MLSKLIFILLVVPAIVFGAVVGPIYQHKDAEDQREFQNIYDQLRKANNYMAPPSLTLAQLRALAPPSAGLIYYCSNCTTDGIVLSTGTAKGAFGRISARTTAIN